MYELIKVTDRAYYVQCPTKIGIVRINEADVCLIDSGSDKDAAKKVLKILNANGWRLTAIYNTHSHADHIGGNKYLQEQTGCEIYASGIEVDFVNHPILEPSLVWSASPPAELRHKFLLAQPSDCKAISDKLLPDCIRLVPLGGHSPDMVGFKTDDGAFFIGDCVSSESTLNKYRVGYIYDIEGYLDTLERLKSEKAEFYIPAHAEVTQNIAPLAQYNIDSVNETALKILEICTQSATFEQILKRLLDSYSLTLSFEQYGLVGSTVRAYITYLLKRGELNYSFEGNELSYKRIPI